MLRCPPRLGYCGLTVIMSNPSRFDKKILLDGNGGYFFNQCLYPITNREQCDIRLIQDKAPLLNNTKAILLLGQHAHSNYTGQVTSIDEHRGNPIMVNNIPCISTFSIQDCMDIKDFESKLNPELNGINSSEDDFDEEDEIFESKGRGKTKRSNYRFWVKHDIKKILKIIENNGVIPKLYDTKPNYIIYPDSNTVCVKLLGAKNDHIYFDMETDPVSGDMRCFAFSLLSDPFNIYVVPCLDINYKMAYSNLPEIIRSFIIAIRENILVAHNGAAFDFYILATKYGIPIKRVYDTMVAAQRIYPKLEKSLGHWVSLCTFEEYHKNLGIHTYANNKQAEQLYYYCGIDVFTMYLIHKWQIEMMNEDSGLKSSIEQAMKLIKPYLTMTLMGMKFDEEIRQKKIKENDALMIQYIRIMQILTGSKVEPLISNKKCVEYFHNQMGYASAGKTKTGNSSLAADLLLKLKLSHDNPVIDFLLKYRETQKETGTLNFKVWQVSK